MPWQFAMWGLGYNAVAAAIQQPQTQVVDMERGDTMSPRAMSPASWMQRSVEEKNNDF